MSSQNISNANVNYIQSLLSSKNDAASQKAPQTVSAPQTVEQPKKLSKSLLALGAVGCAGVMIMSGKKAPDEAQKIVENTAEQIAEKVENSAVTEKALEKLSDDISSLQKAVQGLQELVTNQAQRNIVKTENLEKAYGGALDKISAVASNLNEKTYQNQADNLAQLTAKLDEIISIITSQNEKLTAETSQNLQQELTKTTQELKDTLNLAMRSTSESIIQSGVNALQDSVKSSETILQNTVKEITDTSQSVVNNTGFHISKVATEKISKVGDEVTSKTTEKLGQTAQELSQNNKELSQNALEEMNKALDNLVENANSALKETCENVTSKSADVLQEANDEMVLKGVETLVKASNEIASQSVETINQTSLNATKSAQNAIEETKTKALSELSQTQKTVKSDSIAANGTIAFSDKIPVQQKTPHPIQTKTDEKKIIPIPQATTTKSDKITSNDLEFRNKIAYLKGTDEKFTGEFEQIGNHKYTIKYEDGVLKSSTARSLDDDKEIYTKTYKNAIKNNYDNLTIQKRYNRTSGSGTAPSYDVFYSRCFLPNKDKSQQQFVASVYHKDIASNEKEKIKSVSAADGFFKIIDYSDNVAYSTKEGKLKA